MGPPRVSVVIPTYNERDNIKVLLARLRGSLESRGIRDFEVIVVDDDSPDGTWRVVAEESRRDGRVRLLRRVGERGLGKAVLDGIRESRGEYVVVMDADLQHPPEDVPRLVEAADRLGADIVVASRYARGGGIVGWSYWRRAVSWGARLMAYTLVGESRRTSDPVSGFFLVRRGVSLSCVRGVGYKVLVEILACNPGAKVIDVPYFFRRRLRGSSKLGPADIVMYVIQVLYSSRMARFALVGSTGVAVNLGTMYALLSAGLGEDLSSLGGIEASIASNFALNDLWTFRYKLRGGVLGVASRYLGYHVSVAAGIIVTYSTMKLTHVLLGLHPLVGQFIGILLGFLANYTFSRRIAWRR